VQLTGQAVALLPHRQPLGLLVQAGVLHRPSDLIRHRAHQFPIIEGKAIATDPVSQIDDADAAQLGARRRIADRHANEGAAPVAAVISAGLDGAAGGWIEGMDALLPEDPGGDRAYHAGGTGPSGVAGARPGQRYRRACPFPRGSSSAGRPRHRHGPGAGSPSRGRSPPHCGRPDFREVRETSHTIPWVFVGSPEQVWEAIQQNVPAYADVTEAELDGVTPPLMQTIEREVAD